MPVDVRRGQLKDVLEGAHSQILHARWRDEEKLERTHWTDAYTDAPLSGLARAATPRVEHLNPTRACVSVDSWSSLVRGCPSPPCSGPGAPAFAGCSSSDIKPGRASAEAIPVRVSELDVRS